MTDQKSESNLPIIEENQDKEKIDDQTQNVESANTESELAQAEVEGDAKNSERVILIKGKIGKVKNALKDLGIKDILDDESNISKEQKEEEEEKEQKEEEEEYKINFYYLVKNLEILIRDQIINLRLLHKKYKERFGEETEKNMASSMKTKFKNIIGINRIPIFESAYDFAYKRANKIDKIYDITLDHEYDTWKTITPREMKEAQGKFTTKDVNDKKVDSTGGNKKRTRKMNKKSKANKSRKH